MANSYASALLNKGNEAKTANGDKAFRSTNSSVLDFYSRAGAIRTLPVKDKIRIFNNAFAEDKLLALKALFNLRDVRGGAGERQTVREILKYLAESETEVLKKNLENVVEFGRWDDLLVFFGTPLEGAVLELFKKTLIKDMNTPKDQSISLLAKWISSENASSKTSRDEAIKIRKYLGISSRDYRKMLSGLRSRLRIVEKDMSSKLFGKIDYAQVPARASMIYRNAFKAKDADRYASFQTKVEKGEVKINVMGVNPYELMYKARTSSAGEKTLDLQWKALPNYFKDGVKAIAIADTSGSMETPLGPNTKATCMDVSIAMAVYMAEKNQGDFGGMFITFSSRPTLHKLTGLTLKDKYYNIPKIVDNTNIVAAFDLLLSVAVKNNIPKEEMITHTYVFSDMQFDQADCSGYKSSFETIKAKYERHGYNMPHVVFWNLNGSYGTSPVTSEEKGVTLVSGFSDKIFEGVMKGNTPMDNMLEVLNSKRYEKVTL